LNALVARAAEFLPEYKKGGPQIEFNPEAAWRSKLLKVDLADFDGRNGAFDRWDGLECHDDGI
jgi:hypothetical protein